MSDSVEVPERAYSARISLDFLAKVVVFVTPVLYALGRTFSQSYWNEIGFESALIKNSVEDYVYLGFVMLANALASMIGKSDPYLVWSGPILIFTVFVVGLLTRVGARKIRRKLRLKRVKRRRLNSRRPLKSKTSERDADDAMRLTQAMATILLAFFVLSAIFMIPIVLATKQGEYAAQQTLAKFASGNKTNPEVGVQIGGRARVGRVIQCSDVWCSVYINGDAIPAKVNDLEWLVELPNAGVNQESGSIRSLGKP